MAQPPLFDGVTHDRFVAQPRSGGDRVRYVPRLGIVMLGHGGDAALRPRRGAAARIDLGEYRHLALVREQQRGGEPGGAAADHEDV